VPIREIRGLIQQTLRSLHRNPFRQIGIGLAQCGNGPSLRLDAPVLLEEFVEQHRVHGIVADATEGAVGVGRGLKAIANRAKRPKQRFYFSGHCPIMLA
jgi:hypothetical protein